MSIMSMVKGKNTELLTSVSHIERVVFFAMSHGKNQHHELRLEYSVPKLKCRTLLNHAHPPCLFSFLIGYLQ